MISLSVALAHIADTLEACDEEGVSLPPEESGRIAAALRSLYPQARALDLMRLCGVAPA